MDANSFGARVVDIAEWRKSWIYSLPRFLAQTASGVRRELAHILVRHAEFDGHH